MDDVKRIYRELAKKLHPDMGGNENEMKELNRQYTEIVLLGFPNVRYHEFSDWTAQQKEDWFHNSQQEFHRRYSGFPGAEGFNRFNRKSPNEEYFKQRNDPRLADYERMKSAHNGLLHNLEKLRNSNMELAIDNEKLRNKIKRLERKLKKAINEKPR